MHGRHVWRWRGLGGALLGGLLSAGLVRAQAPAPAACEPPPVQATLQADDLTLHLHAVATPATLQGYPPPAGTRYIVLELTVHNARATPYAVPVTRFRLRGATGAEVEPNALLIPVQPLQPVILLPGAQVRGQLAYAVPREATDLVLRVPFSEQRLALDLAP